MTKMTRCRLKKSCRHGDILQYGTLNPTERKKYEYMLCTRCGRTRKCKPTCVRCGEERKLHRTRIINGNGGGHDAYWNLCRSCRSDERKSGW